MEGTVKWFNRIKRFGFIEGDDGEEYFFHQSAIIDDKSPNEGDKVSFETTVTNKGKQAKDVKLL